MDDDLRAARDRVRRLEQLTRQRQAVAVQLDEVGVHVNPQLPEVDTRWFADVFFDNIITDAIKHQRIARTGEAVTEVARWVSGTVDDLAARRGELARHRDSLAVRREDVLTG
ncbi:hypothetical protein [Streptosporangium roseum]|uniref:hypothetical protein n=1 Tax=Streptosporangium roseum TaxID=2001 RepID=UPI00331A86EB